ncbi:MAG: energy transducer TonB, partial [Thermomonas sp.]|nr:energy transducer TonB [Thermomonas sp.]
MTEDFSQHQQHRSDRGDGVSGPRIAGYSFAIAIHVAIVLVLLTPLQPPAQDVAQNDSVIVTFIEPPPPPPP